MKGARRLLGSSDCHHPAREDSEKPFQSPAMCIHSALRLRDAKPRMRPTVGNGEAPRILCSGTLHHFPARGPPPGKGGAACGANSDLENRPLLEELGKDPPAGEPSTPGHHPDGFSLVRTRLLVHTRLPHSVLGRAGAMVQAGQTIF